MTLRQRLHRLTRIGPRKRRALILLAIVTLGAAMVGQSATTTAVEGALALFVLALLTIAIEVRRSRRSGSRRTGDRPDPALVESLRRANARVAALQHDVDRLHATLDNVRRDHDDERTWRDTRARLTNVTARPRRRLLVFPMTGVNDYFTLIYQEFPRFGFDVVPVAHETGLDGAMPGDVVHFHWTKRVQSGCTTIEQARAASDRWLERFRDLQRRGVSVVWGVHEAVPHECAFPGVEIDFRRELVDLVDLVQVLHPSTAAAVADTFTIPASKSLVVPHPLYTGAQADHVSRAAARADLGLGSNDALLLGFGSIRPYKGYERVIRLLPSLQAELGDRRVTFAIAGPVQWDPTVRRYVDSLRAEIDLLADPSTVRLSPGPVPGNHLQRLLRATDVSVAPYRSGLNSGVLMMNLTFGVPTVIASNPVTEDLAVHGAITTFPPDDDDALRSALVHALTPGHRHRGVDAAFVSANSPEVISAAFAEALCQRLERSPGAAAQPFAMAGDSTG